MLRTRTPSASDPIDVSRRMRAMLAALIAAVGLALLPVAVARAEADSGNGSGDDGSLHLMPEIITNAGISAGGSNDFPVKAQLFLPAMSERAKEREKSQEAITRAIGAIGFERTTNPIFRQDYSGTRGGLFVDYAPQAIPIASTQSDSPRDGLWFLLMVAAAIPLTFLAVFLGRKNASRRIGRHDRATR
jgi:hypothetical protein